MPTPTLLRILAGDCSRMQAARMNDIYGVHFPRRGALLRSAPVRLAGFRSMSDKELGDETAMISWATIECVAAERAWTLAA
jgi:hypothetical protein